MDEDHLRRMLAQVEKRALDEDMDDTFSSDGESSDQSETMSLNQNIEEIEDHNVTAYQLIDDADIRIKKPQTVCDKFFKKLFNTSKIGDKA